MELGDFETTVKVIVVGNGGVGKSSMTARYCKGTFTETYKKTIGVDFLEKSIDIEDGGETVKLMIWDTAGQEEFDALTATYYRGAGACAIVFSTTDRASFDAVEKWKRKVEEECGPVTMALVQNKVDMLAEAQMTPAEVEAKARKLGVKLYRTCVKENVNVAEVFEYLAAQYIRGGGDTSGIGAVPALGDYSSASASASASAAASAAASNGDKEGSGEGSARAGSGEGKEGDEASGSSSQQRWGASEGKESRDSEAGAGAGAGRSSRAVVGGVAATTATSSGGSGTATTAAASAGSAASGTASSGAVVGETPGTRYVDPSGRVTGTIKLAAPAGGAKKKSKGGFAWC